MKLIVAIIIFTVWFLVASQIAAPAKPSMVEYGFWSGLIQGLSWLILLILQGFGMAIHVFADFHTWGYIIGFILGCALSIPVFLFLIARLCTTMFDDF